MPAAPTAVGRPPLREPLVAALEALGLFQTEAQLDAHLGYLDLLERWNRTYNLTAIRDPREMLTQHLVDCLASLTAVRRWKPAGRVLDVGSGGGLPGAVWAIAAPEFEVTCIDSVGKKAAFVRQVATTLRLANLESRHGRVEALVAPAYDLITSRAFGSLDDLVKATARVLAPKGCWVAMKGKVPVEEIAAVQGRATVFHVEPLRIPGLASERCLVWMQPETKRA